MKCVRVEMGVVYELCTVKSVRLSDSCFLRRRAREIAAFTPIQKTRKIGSMVQLVKRTKTHSKGSNRTVEITSAGLEKIATMAANGNSDTTIAHTLGIAHLTFRKLRNNPNEKIDEALQIGRGRLADEITDLILTKARGGNIIAMIFFAKGRLGWRESGPIPQAATTAVQVNIQVPARMTDEEFTKLVEVKTVTVPQNTD